MRDHASPNGARPRRMLLHGAARAHLPTASWGPFRSCADQMGSATAAGTSCAGGDGGGAPAAASGSQRAREGSSMWADAWGVRLLLLGMTTAAPPAGSSSRKLRCGAPGGGCGGAARAGR